MNKKLALSLGILTSSLIALPSTAAPTFTLIYGTNSSNPVVDTDNVKGLVDTNLGPGVSTINYGLFVNEAVNGASVNISINNINGDDPEVSAIVPPSFSSIIADPGDILPFTVTTTSLGYPTPHGRPHDDVLDFTVSVTGGTIYDPIANNNNATILPVDLQTVPEPMTILGSVFALGFGGLMKKNQNRKSN